MDMQTKLYVTQIFDNDLVAIRKSKVTLTPNKPASIGMSILELSKVLMYEFHYDFQFTGTDSFMYGINIEDEEMFDFSNYSTKSNYYDNSNLLLQQ